MTQFIRPPTVTQNPNPRAPLAAVLTFQTDVPVSIDVAISDGTNSANARFPVLDATAAQEPVALPLAGMRADRLHRLCIVATDANGNKAEADAQYQTPPLPPAPMAFPPVTLVKRDGARMEGGITLLSVRRTSRGKETHLTPNQARFSRNWGMILALDCAGEVVWFYQSDRRVAGIDRLDNGNILATHVDFTVMEIDLLGNIVRQWTPAHQPGGARPGSIGIDAHSMHHQPKVLANGNFLSFNAFGKVLDNFYSSESDPEAPRVTKGVVGDEIIEFTPEGRVVWRWNAFDHLDPLRIGYHVLQAYWHVRGFPNHADWTHGNGVVVDPRDGNIIVSFRNQDAVMKIERSSGEILWILGNHEGWNDSLKKKLLRPIGELRWPFHGHNPRVTPQGTIVMFDNGIFQAMPFAPMLPPAKTFSRGVEFEVDEKAMTVRQLWSSSAKLDGDSVNSWAMGDAHRLPKTGNMLVFYSVCFPMLTELTYNEWDRRELHPSDLPNWARIREYSRTTPAEVLWEVQIRDPNDVVGWIVYGGFRVASLMPGN
ncbi:MAG: aryl-sulfate sulfotransferase [Burkholderiales bacterium]